MDCIATTTLGHRKVDHLLCRDHSTTLSSTAPPPRQNTGHPLNPSSTTSQPLLSRNTTTMTLGLSVTLKTPHTGEYEQPTGL